MTHFFLDCFRDDELAPLVQRYGASAKTSRWVVSEFRQPERGFPAWRARLWIGALYRLFGWTTGLRVRQLPDHGRALRNNGFRRTRQVLAEMGLLTSELWERPGVFAFDAPAGARLPSPTPKSSEQAPAGLPTLE